MENIEELFKKVNKEKILIEGHKLGLKRYLLNTEYFNEKKSFDYKLALGATFFSLVIISASFLFLNDNNGNEIAFEEINQKAPEVQLGGVKMMSVVNESIAEEGAGNLYDKLIVKDMVEVYDDFFDEKEVKIVEVFENNITTKYYFNKDKNILIKTEIINNNK